MVLAAHLPLVDDTKYDFAALTLNEERAISREIAQAEAAEKHIAHTGELDDRAFVVSLRLAVAREVYRALQPGGLYLTDGTSDQVKALQAIGFTKLAEIDVNQFDSELVGAAPYYELVLQKK